MAIILASAFLLQPDSAVASPTVVSVQQDIDRLRTLAATKYEAANEANIKVAQLEKETTALQKKETSLRKELDASSKTLARIAILNYQGIGFGNSFELLFSTNPSQYLQDATTLDLVASGYSIQLRKFAAIKQRVQASRLVVADRTSLLLIERKKLNQEVYAAKSALSQAEKVLKTLKKSDREKLIRESAAREGKIQKKSKQYALSYKGDNTRGSIALKFALRQIGDVYVWAAAGPTRWDCSGLTMRAFEQAGVSLPHSSRFQINFGKSISYSALKPGDLLFFGRPISHVSIYMGGGRMVQAPRPGKKVEVVALTKKFGSKPFVGARRI